VVPGKGRADRNRNGDFPGYAESQLRYGHTDCDGHPNTDDGPGHTPADRCKNRRTAILRTDKRKNAYPERMWKPYGARQEIRRRHRDRATQNKTDQRDSSARRFSGFRHQRNRFVSASSTTSSPRPFMMALSMKRLKPLACSS
jgi:hypothetical protein